jgi:hypothetical protein
MRALGTARRPTKRPRCSAYQTSSAALQPIDDTSKSTVGIRAPFRGRIECGRGQAVPEEKRRGANVPPPPLEIVAFHSYRSSEPRPRSHPPTSHA